jgi:PIN domain nuclease of toxin-antitoxin system
MRYLLDTNILIQLVEEPDTVSKNTRNILEDTENLFCISAVSIQEIFMLMRDSKLNIHYWQKPTDVFRYIELAFIFNDK